jgi:TatD family-associated radical SAM protein
VIAELKTAGVGKVSVSLNAEDETTYGEICKPTLKNAYNAAIDFINKAKTELDVEVSAVTTPEIEIYKIKELANKLGVKFRTRQCIPCFW